MNMATMGFNDWLPVIFVALMGLAVLVYAILDGYDLGVGILLPMGKQEESTRDIMIASVGPFWDANETWLVLAIGILLIAFPSAHSLVLENLYLPVVVMLIGIIMRGVAFDFRTKAAIDHKLAWDRAFKIGSILTSLTQGYMLGRYVTGFDANLSAYLFAATSALGVTAAYAYVGSAWLILKTENELQKQSVTWAKHTGRLTAAGVVLVCLVNLWVNPGVYSRWFEMPLLLLLQFIPIACGLAFIGNDLLLRKLPKQDDRHCYLPFVLVMLIFVLCFTGLAFSYFPEIVPGHMTIWQAASAPESLKFILVGAVIVIPCILGYTALSYRIFRGKATHLRYY